MRKMDIALSIAQNNARILRENGSAGAAANASGMQKMPSKNGNNAIIDAKMCG